MYSNSEWKRKLYAFSYACTKWGVDRDQTDRMNRAIEAARSIDTQLYEFCKQTAEVNCLRHLQEMRNNRHPRDDELKKAWHQWVPQNIRMRHPQKGAEL